MSWQEDVLGKNTNKWQESELIKLHGKDVVDTQVMGVEIDRIPKIIDWIMNIIYRGL